MTFPGSPTAFEALVDDYDAARPRYPDEVFDALDLAGAEVLEIGSGTGIATAGLLPRCASVVATDLGPRMLARNAAAHPGLRVAVCAAEQLPFADSSYDVICGAQMWHWTGAAAAAEARRVLRPGGRLALWWNESTDSSWWWDRQQDRLEAGNPAYGRGYRERDYAAELAGDFTAEPTRSFTWSRTLDVPLYERWLRSKSYVQALPDVEAFIAASLADLRVAFPDGQVIEPFVTRLFVLTPIDLGSEHGRSSHP